MLVVVVHMFKELELGRRWADDENGISAVERSSNLTKESMRIVRVFLGFPAPFRMSVKVVLRREDCRFLDRCGVNVKNACFLVIDPDHRVCWHDCILPWRAEVCHRKTSRALQSLIRTARGHNALPIHLVEETDKSV